MGSRLRYVMVLRPVNRKIQQLKCWNTWWSFFFKIYIRNDVKHLIECFCEVACPNNANEVPWVVQKYPDPYPDEGMLKQIPLFAFPTRVTRFVLQLGCLRREYQARLIQLNFFFSITAALQSNTFHLSSQVWTLNGHLGSAGKPRELRRHLLWSVIYRGMNFFSKFWIR